MLLEVGPGQTLTALARRRTRPRRRASCRACGGTQEGDDDGRPCSTAAGAALAGRRRGRLGRACTARRAAAGWPSPPTPSSASATGSSRAAAAPADASRAGKRRPRGLVLPAVLEAPRASRAVRPGSDRGPAARWLLLADGCGLGERLARACEPRDRGDHVVTDGPAFARRGERHTPSTRLAGRPRGALAAPARGRGLRARVVHLWGVTPGDDASGRDRVGPTRSAVSTASCSGARSRRARPRAGHPPRRGDEPHAGGERRGPPARRRPPCSGPCRVIPQEYPGLACRRVDVRRCPRRTRSATRPSRASSPRPRPATDRVVALRGDRPLGPGLRAGPSRGPGRDARAPARGRPLPRHRRPGRDRPRPRRAAWPASWRARLSCVGRSRPSRRARSGTPLAAHGGRTASGRIRRVRELEDARGRGARAARGRLDEGAMRRGARRGGGAGSAGSTG